MASPRPSRDLAAIVGADNVLPGSTEPYGARLHLRHPAPAGVADAVVRPGDAGEVAQVLAWCYERELPVVPRGGGTGYAGGAVPVEGGVVVALDRLTRVRSFEPHWWRAELEAGLTTATVDRLARENGLLFPPNPGAPEQSQIGGQRRHQRRRPAGLQVRGHRPLGHGDRGGGRSWRAGPDRRRHSQGCRRLRPAQPAGRLGGHARDHHLDLAAVRAGSGGVGVGGGVLPRPSLGLCGDRAGARQWPGAGGVEYADAGVLEASRGAFEGGLPDGLGSWCCSSSTAPTDEVRRGPPRRGSRRCPTGRSRSSVRPTPGKSEPCGAGAPEWGRR